ncbi:VWA domain-containing protein [Sulfurovum sp. XGS-02]|uniref:VWA domain-containing protein n=1 Tax=Sulfurovum sp. XGS-02 TaxID=2925411 RepID=UPI002066C99A|nr:VWA domain-containing protein [Sulfurovum sp. XGS-02]UPT77510.1 VWA domain-containing protein [Sulfurovum sp. XGS-02]
MTLLYPSFLWLLIPLALLLWYRSRKLIPLVHLIILMLIVLSLARPVQEEALQEASIEAKDIIIALDVSYSMKAKDITPTRYDFAKETIAALLQANPGDNIMLIAFTTNPLLLSPPTTDHTLINIALENLNPEFILTKGTSLEKLFKRLASMKMEHKNLILITDGGEEEDLDKLTTLLQTSDISLTVLALGTTQGTTIENKDGSLLKDKDDNLVISRVNPLLESLSSSVSGTYLTASSTPEATAYKINGALQENKDQAQQIQKMQRHYLELYQLPLALALLLFFIVHTRAVKYLLLLFTLLGVQAEASMLDNYHLNRAYKSYQASDLNETKKQLQQIKVRSLQSQIVLANTYYKQRAFKKAIQTYKSIRSTSPKIKQQLYYNTANAYAMLESYDKAKIYYTKALQLGEDPDAEHNLKLVALLSDKKSADLGIAHPKSQDSSSSKSESQEETKESKSEDEPSSGSGGGGESQTQKEQEKNKLLDAGEQEQHPLGSKVYELINKGYIRETQPW